MPDFRTNERTKSINQADMGAEIRVVARDVRRGLTLATSGWCVLIGTVLLVVVVVWALNTGYADEHPLPVLAGAALFIVLEVCLLRISLRFVQQGRRLLQPDALTALREDSRRPVFFLRSFADDAAASANPAGTSLYEFVLGNAVSHIGPFVAVGDPDEKLVNVAAARFYVDNEWRAAVLKLMRRSELVILWAAPTDGVLWELEQAVKHLHPEQLLLFFHLGGRSRKARSRYESFRLRACNLLPQGLPSRFKPCGPSFIGFDAEWKPRVLAPSRWGCWHSFADRLVHWWLPYHAFQTLDVVLALRPATKKYGRMSFHASALVLLAQILNVVVAMAPIGIIWALL